MTDSGIDPRQRVDERTILSGRDRRNATHPGECGDRHGKTGASCFRVPRPRVRRFRIKPAGNLIHQFRQLAFQRVIGVQMCRDQCSLGQIDLDTPANQLRAVRHCQKSPLDPVFRHNPVRVCR